MCTTRCQLAALPAADHKEPNVGEAEWDGIGPRVTAAARAAIELGHSWNRRGLRQPPLPAAEVAELETWLGVALPSDYRSYLIEVANGGIGPRGQLKPIERMGSEGWRWDWDPICDPEEVRTPFPTERMNDDARMMRCGPPPFEENFPDLDQFQEAFDRWADAATGGVWAPGRTAGAISIMDRDWADEKVWIIVTGPARGQIWLDSRDGSEDMRPLLSRDDGQPLTFRRWYLEWLDDVRDIAADI
jgi:hypothetical protein